jgi:hypothetical protein
VFRNAPYHGKGLKHNGPYLKPEPEHQGREPHWNPVLWCAGAGAGGDGDGGANGVCHGEIILYFKVLPGLGLRLRLGCALTVADGQCGSA